MGHAGHPRAALPARFGAVQAEGLVHGSVWLQVALYPDRKHKSVPAAVFDLTLKPFRDGSARRWLVDSWAPAGYKGMPSGPLGSDRGPGRASDVEYKSELSAKWLLVPMSAFLLGLVLLGRRRRAGLVAREPRAQALQVALALTARVRGILSSYRWRRRLAWIGGFVVVFSRRRRRGDPASEGSTAGSTSFDRRAPNRRKRSRTSVKQVRLTAAERRAVNRTLVAFVRTGVTRNDPAAAWEPRDAGDAEQRHPQAVERGRVARAAVSRADLRPSDLERADRVSRRRDDRSAPAAAPRRCKRGPIAFAVELKQKAKGGAGSSTR